MRMKVARIWRETERDASGLLCLQQIADFRRTDHGVGRARADRGEATIDRAGGNRPHPALAPPFRDRHLPNEPFAYRGGARHRDELALEIGCAFNRQIRRDDDGDRARLARESRNRANRRPLAPKAISTPLDKPKSMLPAVMAWINFAPLPLLVTERSIPYFCQIPCSRPICSGRNAQIGQTAIPALTLSKACARGASDKARSAAKARKAKTALAGKADEFIHGRTQASHGPNLDAGVCRAKHSFASPSETPGVFSTI